MTRMLLVSPVLLFLAILVLPGCSKDDAVSPTVSDNIKTEASVSAGQGVLETGGSLVTVDASGGPIAGMTIEAPAGAVTTGCPVKVSYETITAHNLGADFNPVSPLVHIQAGSDELALPVVITIPAAIPAGHFAMVFAYDKKTGALEAMPFVGSTATSVTTMTSNFTTTGAGKTGAMGTRTGDLSDWFFVVSSIAPAALDAGDFDSKFLPGVDDWKFTSTTTILSPNGINTGQNLAAIWYFVKRCSAQGHLYGRYDNWGATPTPWLWQDDVHAIRLCSITQKNENLESRSEYYARVYERAAAPDRNTIRSIAYAIAVTHQPQVLFAWRKEDGTCYGSTIIAYRKTGDRILVADPYYAGATDRSILMSGTSFQAYSTTVNPNDPEKGFPNIRHMGCTACMKSARMVALWDQLDAHTVGDAEFPSNAVKAMDDNGDFVDLVDGFTKSDGDMSIIFAGGASSTKLKRVYDLTTLMPYEVEDNRFSLPGGKRTIGLYFTTPGGAWAGFRWINVEITTTDNCVNPVKDAVFDSVPRPLENSYVGVYTYPNTGLTLDITTEDKGADGAGNNVLEIRLPSPAKGTHTIEGQITAVYTMKLPGGGYVDLYASASVLPSTLTIDEYIDTPSGRTIRGSFDLNLHAKGGQNYSVAITGRFECIK